MVDERRIIGCTHAVPPMMLQRGPEQPSALIGRLVTAQIDALVEGAAKDGCEVDYMTLTIRAQRQPLPLSEREAWVIHMDARVDPMTPTATVVVEDPVYCGHGIHGECEVNHDHDEPLAPQG